MESAPFVFLYVDCEVHFSLISKTIQPSAQPHTTRTPQTSGQSLAELQTAKQRATSIHPYSGHPHGRWAGKAVADLESSAGTTREEDRLAVAEHVIGGEFEHHRLSDDGTSFSIWGAQGTCTNISLLTAVDEIILLKETHAFPMASAAGRRMNSVLRTAMLRLMEELLRLRVWDGSQLEGRSGVSSRSSLSP